MKITFYGVRGSIATSGEQFQKHGGCTTCLDIELTPNEHIIFDAGTGIKALGDKLSANPEPNKVHLFLSHHHLDHIQGFPFFQPIYDPQSTINLYSPEIESSTNDQIDFPILDQMRPPYFPIHADALPSTITKKVLPQKNQTLNISNIEINTQKINHPGGGLAYRLQSKQGSAVFITDNELSPSSHEHTTKQEWAEFCKNADLLIHDAHYTDHEINSRKDWGHSSAEDACKLALAANVQYLILFHHDPERTDDQINEICLSLQKYIDKQNKTLICLSAKQGMSINFLDGHIDIN